MQDNIIKQKLTRLTDALARSSGEKSPLRLISAVAVAFFFGCFSAIPGVSPFCVGFVFAIPAEYCFCGLLGSVAGCLYVGEGRAAALCCSALVLCSLLSQLLSRRRISLKRPVRAALASGLLFTVRLTALFTEGFSLYYGVLILCEALLCFLSCWLFALTLESLPVYDKENTDLFYKALLPCTGAVLLLCMSGFTLHGFSPARLLGFSLLLFTGGLKGGGKGSLWGVCMGTALALGGTGTATLAGFSCGGAAAGLFCSKGQLASAAAGLGAALLGTLAAGTGRTTLILCGEYIIAWAVYILTPCGVLGQLERLFKKGDILKDEGGESLACYELRTTARSFYQVSELLEQETLQSDCPEYDMKLSGLRGAMKDQLICMGDFLNELSLHLKNSRTRDCSRSACLMSSFRQAGILADSVSFFVSSEGSCCVEVCLIDRPFDTDWKKMLSVISLMTRKCFELPSVTVTDSRTTLRFEQKPPLSLSLGFSQLSATPGEPCGDSYAGVGCTQGKGFALISDGMGTGEQAHADSLLTCRLMKKLVCSGFSFESAARCVNSLLLSRERGEAFSTVDALEVNLFDGTAIFYKAGAGVSLVRKRDSIGVLERACMPLGILRQAGLCKNRFTAEAGDIVLLMSDGVSQAGTDWIEQELLSWSTDDMQQLSMHILRLARLRQKNMPSDDMTVAAVKIEKNRKYYFGKFDKCG